MLTFAFMHHPYLVCILFGMPSLHLFTFLMFFLFLFSIVKLFLNVYHQLWDMKMMIKKLEAAGSSVYSRNPTTWEIRRAIFFATGGTRSDFDFFFTHLQLITTTKKKILHTCSIPEISVEQPCEFAYACMWHDYLTSSSNNQKSVLYSLFLRCLAMS